MQYLWVKYTMGAELWGGVPNYIKKKIQSLQLEMARTTIGHHSHYWSRNKTPQTNGLDECWPNIGICIKQTKPTEYFTTDNLSYYTTEWPRIDQQTQPKTRLSGPLQNGLMAKKFRAHKINKEPIQNTNLSLLQPKSQKLIQKFI